MVEKTADQERLISMRDVCRITSWSRSSIHRLEKSGVFPARVELGTQRVAYRESEICAYVASRRPKEPERVSGTLGDAAHQGAGRWRNPSPSGS